MPFVSRVVLFSGGIRVALRRLSTSQSVAQLKMFICGKTAVYFTVADGVVSVVGSRCCGTNLCRVFVTIGIDIHVHVGPIPWFLKVQFNVHSERQVK